MSSKPGSLRISAQAARRGPSSGKQREPAVDVDRGAQQHGVFTPGSPLGNCQTSRLPLDCYCSIILAVGISMHLEVPKAKKWKEFSSEYLMIVVSIITALGLEHAVQTYHHRQQAQEASERIEAELRADLGSVETVLKHNESLRKRIETLRIALRDEIKRGTPDQAAIKRVLDMDPHGIQLAIHGPSLRHEAWDVAVANQAAGFIEPRKLERYASLYAHMRDIDTIANGSGNRFYDGASLVAAFGDLDLGTVSARDLLHTLQQIEWSYNGADGNLQNLRDDLAETFGSKSETTAQR